MSAIRSFFSQAIKHTLFLGDRAVSIRNGRFRRDRFLILQYHSVPPSGNRVHPYVTPTLGVPLESFEKQMQFIRERFEVVSLDQLLHNARDGEWDHRAQVAVTFDDGYRDNYEQAFPILRKYQIPAMIYLTAACIGEGLPLWTSRLSFLFQQTRKDRISLHSISTNYPTKGEALKLQSAKDLKRRLLTMTHSQREEVLSDLFRESGVDDLGGLTQCMLDWQQVREMRRAGIHFGSHTLSHPSLPYIPAEEARAEISDSKRIIEEQLGEQIFHFSYPNPGDVHNFSEEVKAWVRSSGYRSATTSCSGYVQGESDLFELRRVKIYRRHSPLHEFYFQMAREHMGIGLDHVNTNIPCGRLGGQK